MTEPPPPRISYKRPSPSELGWGGAPRQRAGTYERRHPMGRRWPRRVLILANAMVALTIIGTASAYGYVSWRLGQIHKTKLHSLAAKHGGNSAAFTMLIVGSDSRAALTGPDNQQFGGAANVGGQRSDTILVARVVPATKQIMLMSIPRDLWVNIPGQGMQRINTAFGSGPDLLVKTIETDLGIPINHYVEVNFDSFREISNAVGGIKVYFPTPAKDDYSLLSIPTPGCYSLKGDQALAFVRARHYEYYQNGSWHFEALSDLARVQRQQVFVKRLLKKAETEYTNPIAINDIIAGLVKNLTVDSTFSTSLMLDLARDFSSINAAAIPSLTMPNYPFVTAGGADVLGLQQPQASQTIAAFNAFGAPKPKAPAHTTKPTLPAVTVPPSSINIEVANGSGAAGQAGQMSQTLSALGYHTSVTYSSPGSGYATTQVLYAPDAATAGAQIAAQIPGGATTAVDSALTPTPYNVEVVTGSSYGNGTASTSTSHTTTGSASTSSVATTATTIPGTNPSEYELPGATGPPPATCA